MRSTAIERGMIPLYGRRGGGREVEMTDAQSWTLLGMVGVLLSVIGALIVSQLRLLRDIIDVRFDALNLRFESLDRDVHAIATALFRRE